MPPWAVAAAYGLMAVAVWSGATTWGFNRAVRRTGRDPWQLQPQEWTRHAGVLMCIDLLVPLMAVALSRGVWMAVSAAVYVAALLVAWWTVRRWGLRLAAAVVWIVPGGTLALLAVAALPFD